MKKSNKVVAGIAVLAVIGVSGFAFAHGGSGGGGYHMGMGGSGHMMGYNGNGDHMGYGNYGRGQGLSKEKIEALGQAREKFYNASRQIRNAVYQKRLDLSSELAKQNLDANKLRSIQKDLSRLQSELDQKRLDHELEVNKLLPESRRGYAGRGYGHGFGGHHMD